MGAPVISGDGVFSHTTVGANDLQKSTIFYDAVLATLGIKNLGPFGDNCFLYSMAVTNRICSSCARQPAARPAAMA